jgi:hypothetical protein
MVKCNMDSIWSWMIFLMFHFIFLIRFWMGEYELSCRISMENLDRYELLYSREIRSKKTIACKKGYPCARCICMQHTRMRGFASGLVVVVCPCMHA